MIPFLDLTRQYRYEKKLIQKVVNEILASGRYLKGSQVNGFEKEFARFLGVTHVVATGSGTDALSLSLLALGVKPGDRVIMPANSCHSLFGIVKSGAIPLPVDIDPHTYNIDSQALVKLATKNVKAVLFVHMYGNPMGVLEVVKFAKAHNLALIEDSAQAHGARIGGKMAGSLGDLSIFSFYPTKNLACLSDGGAISTNSQKLALKVRFLATHGERKRFQIEQIGLTSNLDEIQSAILRVKLTLLDGYNKKRQALAKLYESYLKDLPLTLPGKTKDAESVFHLFVIRTPKRQLLKDYLFSKGIETDIHYPIPLHLQPALRYLGYKKGDFPDAEEAAKTVLSLPLYPYLQQKEAFYICQAIKQFFS